MDRGTGSRSTTWEVPEPRSTFDVELDDRSIAAVRRHGNPAGPRLVLSHGAGLAIDLYVPFWGALLDDFDVFLYDIRDHGWNAVGELANHTVPNFARDHDRILAAIDRHCGPKPKIGVYHSLAAITAMAALGAASAGGAPLPWERYSALVLFDPPFCVRGMGDEMFFDLAALAEAKTRRRTRRFASLEDFEDRVASASRFARVAAGVHNLLARTTLRERPDGSGYELRCPPEYEARVCRDAPRWARRLSFAGVGCPVKVIGSDPALPYTYVPTLEADQLALIEYEFIPGTTHLLQLEAPAKCAAAMLAFLRRRGLMGAVGRT